MAKEKFDRSRSQPSSLDSILDARIIFRSIDQERYLGHLDTTEIKTVVAEYTRIAEDATHEGNPDLLRLILEDQKNIQNLLQHNEELESLQDRKKILTNLDELCRLIASPFHEHPLFSKVLASAAYCEVSLRHGLGSNENSPRSLFRSIEKGEDANPTNQYLSALLFGAYRARLLYWHRKESKTKEHIPASPFGDDEKLLDKAEARFDLAVATVGIVYRNFLEQEMLDVSLPHVTIAQTRILKDQEDFHPQGSPYPDKVMFLAPSYLTSLVKLQRAAQFGVPTSTRSVVENRLPSLLIGVLTQGRGSEFGHFDESKEGADITTDRRRRFSYVRLPALRKPKYEAKEIFGDVDKVDQGKSNLYDEFVSEFGAFDALSYIIAMRIARLLNTPMRGKHETLFEFLEGRSYASMRDRPIEKVRAHIEKKKLRAFENRVNRWIEYIQISQSMPNGQKQNILSVALSEAKQSYGDLSTKEAIDHLKHTVMALVLRNSFGPEAEVNRVLTQIKLVVRTEEEIIALYNKRILEQDLVLPQKVEMMLELMRETIHPLWRSDSLDTPEKTAIRQYLENETSSLDDHIQHKLANMLGEYIQLRCETVRDKYTAPKSWETLGGEELLDEEI